MNGTVTPSVVVVLATEPGGGGLFGSYGWNDPPLLLLFVPGSVPPCVGVPAGGERNLNVAAWSHWLSFAPCWHVRGWICGPARPGPPIGWLVTHSRAAIRRDARPANTT